MSKEKNKESDKENHSADRAAALWRPEVTLEILNQRGDGYLPGLLGVEVLHVGPGVLRGRMKITSQHMAPNGFLHAASVVTLADTCCGFATVAHLPSGGRSFTTLEIKTNYLSSVKAGATILCDAAGDHLGRTTQVWSATVSDEESGRKLAIFRCTQLILM